MTLKQARRYARKWQRRLGLRDWDVTVRFVHPDDYQDPNCTLGECRRHHAKKTAQLVLRRPGNNTRDQWPQGSIKLTILHELLHLHTSGWEPGGDTAENKMMEQMVHQVSLTLRTLEKGQR